MHAMKGVRASYVVIHKKLMIGSCRMVGLEFFTDISVSSPIWSTYANGFLDHSYAFACCWTVILCSLLVRQMEAWRSYGL